MRVYIEDFCIYSSRVLHLVRVDEGLSRLAQMGGQLNMAKCHIGETQVTLLGHLVSGAGIQVDPSKVSALLALSSRTTVKELTSFIQKVRYFGRFIHQSSLHSLYSASPMLQFWYGMRKVRKPFKKSRRC